MTRRQVFVMWCAAIGWLLSSSLAWAQEAPPAAPPSVGLAAVLLSIPGRLIGAALVVALVESFKAWRDRVEPPAPEAPWVKRAAYAVLVSPAGRLVVALVLSLPAAGAAWAAGAPIAEVGTLVLSNWLGGMGLNAALGVVSPKGSAKSSAVLIVLLALLSSGCTSAQARIASALAISGAGLERPLHAAETAAGRAELVRVHDAGGTRADGDHALEALEARWAPAWAALDLFLAADSAWLDAILAQEDGDWGRLVDSACGLLRAATPLAPEAIGRFAAIAAPVCPSEVSP